MTTSTTICFLFRPALLQGEGNDLPFLRELYASTRQEELAVTGWPPAQIDAFLGQQFEAQHRCYMEQFGGADFDLILDETGEGIGRLYLEERDAEFRVIDIALLPEFRRQGIGRKIMQDIIDRAFAMDKAVRIHVEMNNVAISLYERLGFKMVEDQGVYCLMEVKAPASTPNARSDKTELSI